MNKIILTKEEIECLLVGEEIEITLVIPDADFARYGGTIATKVNVTMSNVGREKFRKENTNES